jgi:hypothetical protein
MMGRVLLVVALCFMFSCRSEIRDMKSLYKWINDPENGLVKAKDVEGIKLTVKYLPAEFLALKETKEEGGNDNFYDSLLNFYKKSHTFLLSIASKENENTNDPMYKDLQGYTDYKQRALEMNFDMNEYVSIKTASKEYRPVLFSMENSYGLKGQRNIYLVFTDDAPTNQLMKEQELDFIFEDEIFQTGTNHFVFSQRDFNSIPEINFNTIN